MLKIVIIITVFFKQASTTDGPEISNFGVFLVLEGVGDSHGWVFGKSTSFLNVSGYVDMVRKKQNQKILSFKKVTAILQKGKM